VDAQKNKHAAYGERHHKATLTDHEIDLIRELREEYGFGYRRLAKKFEVSRETIRSICAYRTRFARCAM